MDVQRRSPYASVSANTHPQETSIMDGHTPPLERVGEHESTPEPAYLSYRQLSARTGLSVSTLRRRVRDGTLQYFQPGGSRTRIIFAADVVERCLDDGAAGPAIAQSHQAPPTRRRGPKPKWMNQR
jgi:excisionase family DNA binding protein